MKRNSFIIICCSISIEIYGQQLADTTFVPKVLSPAYQGGGGPLVLIDEAHNNFHTALGRYSSFAKLLRADGLKLNRAVDNCFRVGAIRMLRFSSSQMPYIRAT